MGTEYKPGVGGGGDCRDPRVIKAIYTAQGAFSHYEYMGMRIPGTEVSGLLINTVKRGPETPPAYKED